MTEDAVRKTEALVYDADESVEVGFADRIGDLRTETAALAARNYGEKTMTDKTQTETQPQAVDTAKIASDARAEERKLFAEVQGSEHYAGREALAQKFLSTTDMSAEQIIGFLEDAPKVEAPKEEPKTEDKGGKRNHFAEAMDKEGGPQVGSIDDDDTEGEMIDGRPAATVSILSAYKASGGRTRKTS